MNILSQELAKPAVEKIVVEMSAADYALYVGMLRRFCGRRRSIFAATLSRRVTARETLVALGEAL